MNKHNVLIGFLFDTGDSDYRYEVWVIAGSDKRVDYQQIHGIVNNEPYCDLNLDEDEEYEDVVERLMNDTEYTWRFFSSPANNINDIFTFCI